MENKIETIDALAAKLLQRFTYSVSAMRSTSQSLSEGNFQNFAGVYNVLAADQVWVRLSNHLIVKWLGSQPVKLSCYGCGSVLPNCKS